MLRGLTSQYYKAMDFLHGSQYPAKANTSSCKPGMLTDYCLMWIKLGRSPLTVVQEKEICFYYILRGNIIEEAMGPQIVEYNRSQISLK